MVVLDNWVATAAAGGDRGCILAGCCDDVDDCSCLRGDPEISWILGLLLVFGVVEVTEGDMVTTTAGAEAAGGGAATSVAAAAGIGLRTATVAVDMVMGLTAAAAAVTPIGTAVEQAVGLIKTG